MIPIEYRSLRRYKYQLLQTYVYDIPSGFLLVDDQKLAGEHHWVSLDMDEDWARTLTIRSGYCWDGPSGPTIDTLNTMRGSLIHDALYQLMREHEQLRKFRDDADRLMQREMRADGMTHVRASTYYWGVKTWGRRSAGE